MIKKVVVLGAGKSVLGNMFSLIRAMSDYWENNSVLISENSLKFKTGNNTIVDSKTNKVIGHFKVIDYNDYVNDKKQLVYLANRDEKSTNQLLEEADVIITCCGAIGLKSLNDLLPKLKLKNHVCFYLFENESFDFNQLKNKLIEMGIQFGEASLDKIVESVRIEDNSIYVKREDYTEIVIYQPSGCNYFNPDVIDNSRIKITDNFDTYKSLRVRKAHYVNGALFGSALILNNAYEDRKSGEIKFSDAKDDPMMSERIKSFIQHLSLPKLAHALHIAEITNVKCTDKLLDKYKSKQTYFEVLHKRIISCDESIHRHIGFADPKQFKRRISSKIGDYLNFNELHVLKNIDLEQMGIDLGEVDFIKSILQNEIEKHLINAC